MKAKLHVKTIETPEDIATGPNGEPGWVKLRTRIKKKYLAILGELVNTAVVVKELPEDTEDDEISTEALKAIAAFNQVNDKHLLRAYANIVTDWNWIDDESEEPLDKPANNPQVFGELVEVQLMWIQEQIGELRRYAATEGNEPKGDS